MTLLFFYSFIILSVLLLVVLFYWDLKRRSPFLILWLIILFYLTLPSFSDPFNRVVDPHPFASTLIITDQGLIIYAVYSFFVLFSFLLIYILSSLLYTKNNNTVLLYNNVYIDDKKDNYYIAFLMTSFIGFFIFYKQFGINILSSLDFTTRREYSTPLLSFLLTYPFMICCGLALYYLTNRKYLKLTLSVIPYLILFLIFGGSRQPLVALITPIALYYCIGKEKINYRFLILIIISSIFLKPLFSILLYLRNLPSFEERLIQLSSPVELYTTVVQTSRNDGTIRYAFYYFIENAKSSNDYFNLEYLGRTLLFWLPSSFDVLNIKPNDFEYKMFSDYMNGKSGTMHPSIFGSIYADSGWLFFPWVIIFGLFLYFTPIYIQKFKGVTYICLWSVCCFYSFMLARGSLYAPITVIMVAIFFAIIITKIKFIKG